MMRKLLATTALAMAFATGALAQDITAPTPPFRLRRPRRQ